MLKQKYQILILFFLVSCDYKSKNTVIIHNKSNQTISNIYINFAGNVEYIKKIKPNSEFVVIQKAKNEGVIDILYEINGKIETTGFAYIDQTATAKCNISIDDKAARGSCERN